MIKYAQKFLRTHSWFVAIFQASLIGFSLVLAWLLRFDYSLPDRRSLLLALPVLVPIRLDCDLAVWPFARLVEIHGRE